MIMQTPWGLAAALTGTIVIKPPPLFHTSHSIRRIVLGYNIWNHNYVIVCNYVQIP